eukprot:11991305-Alexandrium_andersonii.AAC.1
MEPPRPGVGDASCLPQIPTDRSGHEAGRGGPRGRLLPRGRPRAAAGKCAAEAGRGELEDQRVELERPESCRRRSALASR